MEQTHRWYPLVREWERTLRAENKSKNTIGIYGHCTRLMIRWLDALPREAGDLETVTQPQTPADIKRAHIATWMADLLATGAPGNANNKYRSIQQWFNWLLAEGEIEVHPMARMKPPFVPEKPVPLVPDELIRKVLDQCKGRDLMSRRDTATIRLIWDTGARLSEIAALNVGDVDLDTDVIHVLGKGRRPPAVPFGPKTGQAMGAVMSDEELVHRVDLRMRRQAVLDREEDPLRLWSNFRLSSCPAECIRRCMARSPSCTSPRLATLA